MSAPPAAPARRPLALLLWGALAAVLLTTAFLAYVALAAQLVAGDGATVRRTQGALILYARVVLAKGLLPQLAIVLALWPLADRWLDLESRGARGVVAGLLGLSAVGAVAVLPILATEWPGLPAVKLSGVLQALRTVAEMTAGVAAAALVPKLALPVLRPRRRTRTPAD